MLEKVAKTIEQFGMIGDGQAVLVAVSGGVDSVVMLHALGKLSGRFSSRLMVCHLNHGLRGAEADRDYGFVKKLAASMSLKFVGGRLKPGELKGLKGFSVQEAARVKRYQFLEDSASKYGADVIALGHTLDDQAETVFMRFIKGSGLSGLSGIPPVRGPFIRPLIEVTRAEVEDYAKRQGLGFVEDSSNRDPRYLRNDIRLNLIPFVEKRYNPRFKETVARFASVISIDDEYLWRQANGVLPEVVIERTPGSLTLDRTLLTSLHDSMLTRVFLLAVEILKEKSDLYSYHIASFLKIIKGPRPNASIVLPDGLSVVREYDRVVLSTVERREAGPFDYPLRIPGTTRVPEAGALVRTAIVESAPETLPDRGLVVYFDLAGLPRPLRVRSFAPGDRMAPLGMKGRHKKVKEIFIENKVPKSRRPATPILTAGEEVIWVAGLRRTEHYKVGRSTAKALKVEVVEMEEPAGGKP
ncbi:MAG: tRNA lysidine(34) synthetase TilS, partial [Thermodesulfobacteriota bacterium]